MKEALCQTLSKPFDMLKNFLPLRSFSARKIVAFVAFCSLNFVLLVDFDLIYVLVRLNFFRKEKNRNCPETSFTVLLTCAPLNPSIEDLFVRTYFYL